MAVKRKPEWLRINLKTGRSLDYVNNILKEFSLNTVCQEAKCPNRMECFSKKTATFMILGRECSRGCKFCNVSHGELERVDENEPENVAKATVELGLKHVVITSVTRDDISDGGAEHFSKVIKEIKKKDSNIIIEVLIPDLQGDEIALKKIIDAKPHVINHNMETVSRLYENVRPQAIYQRSLKVLENVKKINPSIHTKSGIMVGLGEREDEVLELLKDLRAVGCDYLTIGQYLAPSKEHYPIEEYVHPDIFKKYKDEGLSIGFSFVASDPLVRSSYNAAEMLAHA